MNKDDILIVKYPLMMRERDVKMLYESILRQKESGVIILPDYCDIIVAPKDTELYVEQSERVKVMTKDEHTIEKMFEEGKLELPGAICTNEEIKMALKKKEEE